MTQITEHDRQAGWKALNVSMRDGRVLSVRVGKLEMGDLLGLVPPTQAKLDTLVAKAIGRELEFVMEMNEICHAEIMSVSFQLMGIDLGATSELLDAARKLMASEAPDKI